LPLKKVPWDEEAAMQFGVCVSLAQVEEVLPSKPDFIEENIQSFLKPNEPDAAFAANLAAARKSPVPIAASNCFLPGSLKCTGPDVKMDALLKWASVAFPRAKASGMEILVFGSGGARKYPDGFDPKRAFSQYVELLKKLGPLAAQAGIVLVVEPLNHGETNLINSLAEGAEAVRGAEHPNVQLLADLFHMLRDGEPADEIVKVGKLLRHAHLAENKNRAAPGTSNEDFRPYFAALKKAGYDRRMALECGWTQRKQECGRAMEIIRKQWQEA
jgi:sugar phosphate isomerase/epimerase